MLSWFSAGHGLKFATPSRVPPDPRLFPNYIQNAQGLWLRCTEWWPRREVETVKGVVFIISGLGEHAGRYDSVALRFTEAGYACFSVDQQGAGGSEGVRLYVERFDHFVDDYQLFIHHIQIKYPELTKLPRFLLGHSMGGLIATHVAMRDPDFFHGVVLSGPAHGTDVISPCVKKLTGLLSSFLPKLPGTRLAVGEKATSNPPVAQLMDQDAFYTSSLLRARFGYELFHAQDKVFALVDTDKSSFPFLIVSGEKDVICDPAASRRFYEKATSTDKEYKLYAGARHEVLTEVCRQQVMDDVLAFVEKRSDM